MEENFGEEKSFDVPNNSSDVSGGFTKKIRENPWIMSTLILGAVCIFFLFFSNTSFTGNVISSEDAGSKLISFYESNGATGLELDSVEEISGLYQVNIKYDGNIIPIYMTKDGSMAGSLTPLVASEGGNAGAETSPQEIPKADKPKVELFVMTHCPYGTQSEKGLIPTIKALGSLVDAKIRFVHYTMHGDVEDKETSTQVCIREEQASKWYSYLECFLEDANTTRCISKVQVDKTKLDDCIKNSASKYYAEDSKLSQSYGVQGSPTLVINGVSASSGRSSSAYLTTICSAFNTAPEKCSSLNLSSTTPGPGFGWESSGAASSTAQC